MSGGSKKTTTTDQKQATTTELPAWMTAAGADLYSKAAAMPAVGAYQGPMTAGSSANQQAASAAARANAGTWKGDLDASRAMTGAAAMAPQATIGAERQGVATYQAAGGGAAPQVTAGNVGTAEFGGAEAAKYMTPYLAAVQGSTLAEMQRQAGIDRAGLDDNVQGAKAFGGGRHALLESEMARNNETARTDYINRSTADAFANAQGQFNTDRQSNTAVNTGNADRSLQAGTTNASLIDQLMGRMDAASSQNADARNKAMGANADRTLAADTTNANSWEAMLARMMGGGQQMGDIATSTANLGSQDVRNLASTGAADQATDDAGKSAAYQEYLRAGNAPLENIKDIMAILNGTPRNVSTTGTSSGTSVEKTNPGLLNTLLAAAQAAGAAAPAFSDPRLKKHVGLIERMANGLGVYRFRYLWEKSTVPAHIGVMADEVARIVPEALGPVIAGYMTVNYGKLGEMVR